MGSVCERQPGTHVITWMIAAMIWASPDFASGPREASGDHRKPAALCWLS